MTKLRGLKRTDLLQRATLLIAVLATIFYLFSSIYDWQRVQETSVDILMKSNHLREELIMQKAMIDKTTARNEELLREISLLTSKSSNTSESQRQMALLKQDLSNISSSLTTVRTDVDSLKHALESNPEKALTMPLLKKDVDDLKSTSQRELDSLRGEMARNYDLNKWLIGLILAAVLGVVVQNAFPPKNARNSTPRFE